MKNLAHTAGYELVYIKAEFQLRVGLELGHVAWTHTF
jgi:hypothetical protein